MEENEKKLSDVLASKRTDLAGDRTQLAVERTVMAANRTLMAWVRTGLSLISFGFTIYKFLQAATESAAAIEGSKFALLQLQGPRRLGLFLIAIGTTSVMLVAIEYFKTVKRLNKKSTVKNNPFNFSFIIGILIGLLGLFLFITIIINREFF